MQGGAAALAYRGRTASIGFAHGPFVRVDADTGGERVAGSLVELVHQLARLVEERRP